MSVSILIPVVLGILAGYLVNYLTDFLPKHLKLITPICRNPSCGVSMKWSDYLLMHRCQTCHKGVTFRFILVLVLSLAFSLYIWVSPPAHLGFFTGFVIFFYLFLVALIDFETRLVLRSLSLFGLVICLLAGLGLHSWQSTLLGALAGFGIMFILYLFGILFSRFRNKRLGNSQDGEEALGSGDVTLAVILGLLLGWPLIWFNLLTGILLAGIFSFLMMVVLLLTRRFRSMLVFISYGPFFIFSAVVLVYFSNWVTTLLPAG
jgi:prepilin signal peptidase PulO-like enzyme (type II secretory pathway)